LAIYLAPISNGLGDLIVSIPILQSLIKTGEPTYLVMRSPAQYGLSDRIPGLAGSIKESEFNPEALSPDDRFYNFRAHPLQSDYIWGSAEFEAKYPGFRINDILAGICRDWGIEADFERLIQMPFKFREDFADRIVFVPGSSGIFKCWSATNWISLYELLKAAGRQVIVVGQPDRSSQVRDVIAHGVPHVETKQIGEAVDAVSSASCVVSVDTGLMHIAVHQNTPTVALFRYNTMFMRSYKHKRSLIAPLCDPACIERELKGAPNEKLRYTEWALWDSLTCALDDGSQPCARMSEITANMVYDAVMDLLAERG